MVPKTCAVADCELAAHSRGRCKKHYDAWRRDGNGDKPTFQPAKDCAVDSCPSKQHARGYCAVHLYRLKTYGDPLVEGPGRTAGRPRAEEPTYVGMHKRLRLDRGKASAHACVDCGNPAHEWSYDGGCPGELHEVRGKLPCAYSTDQSRYSPRCRPCHRTRDESLNRPRGADGRFVA